MFVDAALDGLGGPRSAGMLARLDAATPAIPPDGWPDNPIA